VDGTAGAGRRRVAGAVTGVIERTDADGWLGEPENGWDESADREAERYDWPDGEVPA
jgi:hypothetical protein